MKTAKHPLCPKLPIIILLLGPSIGLGLLLGRLRVQDVQRVLIRRVDVLFLGRNRHLGLVAVLGGGHHPEVGAHFVVAFGAPGDVVHVGELREQGGRGG
jgi:hypothetical protein